MSVHAPCRTRFAPSPTGSLHVGGVRTALYCLLWARHTDGAFVLRIEDTDRVRSSDAATEGIQADLKWLGMDWDEGPGIDTERGPYFQSQRLDLYNEYVDQLLAEGKAYEAWESREELADMRRAAQAEKRTFRFRRPDYSEDDLARFQAEGRVPVVRLMAPDHAVTVDDAVLGPVTQEAHELDDIVIRKQDGYPTYHFAVVVDDHHMAIDLVLRGQEHLMNTHKHHGLFEALGWEPTPVAHLPLIFNPSGSKMSKRDKAKEARRAARDHAKQHPAGWAWLADLTQRGEAEIELFMRKKSDDLSLAIAIAAALEIELPLIEVLDFRREGYLPEALLNYLALLGWSSGDDREFFTLDELNESFEVTRISKTPARFDREKLRWLNGEYLRGRVGDERIASCMDAWLEVQSSDLAEISPERRMALFQMYRPRIHTFGELDRAARFLFHAPESYDPKATAKHLLKGGGVERLVQLRAALRDVGRWESASLERALGTLVEQTGASLGKFAQPLRIALSGTAVTPGIYDVLAFLGREETLDRVGRCLEHFADDISFDL